MKAERLNKVGGSQGKLFAFVPVFLVINLLLGAPLSCQIHCLALADELTAGEQTPPTGIVTPDLIVTYAGLVKPLRADPLVRDMLLLVDKLSAEPSEAHMQLHCQGRSPGSKHLAPTATYESAVLFRSFPIQSRLALAFIRISGVKMTSVYLSPPEKPPALSSQA